MRRACPALYTDSATQVARWAARCGLPHDRAAPLNQFGTADPIAIARFLAYGDRSRSQPA